MIYIYLTNLFNAIVCSCLIEKHLHIFQLKDYNTYRYFNFLKKKPLNLLIFLPFSILFLINYLFFNNNLIININLNLLIIFINTITTNNLINSSKTPIKYTAKLKRLYSISVVLIFLFHIIPCGVLISIIILPLTTVIANAINLYDKIKNRRYIQQAVQKLRLSKTKVIAITGSNGKTSVKNILHSLLQTKYKVQATPKSYNTELGIAMFINENLQEDSEYLILEYGARHKNDIKKLCKLYGADYGIITCVNPQHMETFKTIDTVYETKSTLSTYLSANMCVYNLDNIHTSKMHETKIGNKLGVSILNKSDIYASDVRILDNKTNFTLHHEESDYSIYTNLLGRHNVTNILLATAMALYLKVELCDIINQIQYLQSTPHRLELIKSHINILDDSYNCSTESANEALWVLEQMSGKHMVATPGIIEGGKSQYNINYGLGRKLATCDTVIIIGKTNYTALSEGLNSVNYGGALIHANSLEQAKTHFNKLKKGDTLLLLNDLPDDYD